MNKESILKKNNKIEALMEIFKDFNCNLKLMPRSLLSSMRPLYGSYIFTYLKDRGYADDKGNKIQAVYVGDREALIKDFKAWVANRMGIENPEPIIVKAPVIIPKRKYTKRIPTILEPSKKILESLIEDHKEKVSKAVDFISSEELVTELRRRGYTVTCTKTQTIEL
jgi:hypothetical protein